MNSDNSSDTTADGQYKVDHQLVEQWLKGWSLARELPMPVRDGDAYRVDVGWPQQWVRYVFPELNAQFRELAEIITEPWVLLKVCAPPEAVQVILPPCWTLDQQRFMMTRNGSVASSKIILPEGYISDTQEGEPVSVVRIWTTTGEVVAVGRIIIVDDVAIYDRIETQRDHRRLGLASAVMAALEQISGKRNISKGVLVATADGRMLYETLGWQLYSLYTTAVIPGLVSS